MGRSQLLCVDWLLAWNVVSLEVRLSSSTHFQSGHLGMCSGGHLFFIWSNFWLCSLHQVPEITWFTVMGYPPVLLSDKISASPLLPLLTLQLLTPESEHVFALALTSPARPSTPQYPIRSWGDSQGWCQADEVLKRFSTEQLKLTPSTGKADRIHWCREIIVVPTPATCFSDLSPWACWHRSGNTLF